MTKKLRKSLENIRDAIGNEARDLSNKEYVELFEELLTDAEGWKMELAEMEGDE
jgi:hypothetical protein